MQKEPERTRSPRSLAMPSASPVSSDSSTVRPRVAITSPSATSWSPGPTATTSPGTTSVASSSTISPSRMTRAWGATRTASSSSVAFAFSSWRMPM